MHLFLKKIFWFFVLLGPLIIIVALILLENNPHVYQQLYNYQLEKLKTNKPYSTLFIGDSSLGTAIDSDKFSNLSSQLSVNCALTGLYGYAGSYNMLKTAKKYNSSLKNVILMQTLDMQTRKVAMDGYVRSSSTISDFIETEDKLDFVQSYVRYIQSIPLFFWIRKEDLLVNDYITQVRLYEPDSIQIPLSIDSIKTDKCEYLIKIRDYCIQNDLNLIYIHGPLYEEKIAVSQKYIDEVNRILNTHRINVIESTISIKKSQLGDQEDHVHPNYKKEFTKRYYELLIDHLTY
jgi:hypothetical protein